MAIMEDGSNVVNFIAYCYDVLIRILRIHCNKFSVLMRLFIDSEQLSVINRKEERLWELCENYSVKLLFLVSSIWFISLLLVIYIRLTASHSIS
jgi:hypothetical protein